MQEMNMNTLKGLPSVSWRSEKTLMTNEDTLTLVREAAQEGLLGAPVTVRVGECREYILLVVGASDGVKLASRAIPFYSELVPPRTAAGMDAVLHVVNIARDAVDQALSAYEKAIEAKAFTRAPD